MVELQVKLPDWAGEYIQQQVAAGRFSSTDEMLADLVDQARIQAAKKRLAELIQEGLDSGEGVEVNDAYWEQLDERVRAELERTPSL
ncbi:MAG: hypothetical protein WD872_11900 [Pirellulaceae bacterium]